MAQDDQEEWQKCLTASRQLLEVLFEVTPGPRLGLITAMMFLITVAETVDATQNDTLQSLRSLWDIYKTHVDKVERLQ